MKYMTQVHTGPHLFVIFSNYPKLIPMSYRRFIENQLRENFDLFGVPVRVSFRRKMKKASAILTKEGIEVKGVGKRKFAPALIIRPLLLQKVPHLMRKSIISVIWVTFGAFYRFLQPGNAKSVN